MSLKVRRHAKRRKRIYDDLLAVTKRVMLPEMIAGLKARSDISQRTMEFLRRSR